MPVIPFALTQRAGVPAEDGVVIAFYLISERPNADGSLVQHWVSVLLAVYGAALLSASRKSLDSTNSSRLVWLLTPSILQQYAAGWLIIPPRAVYPSSSASLLLLAQP